MSDTNLNILIACSVNSSLQAQRSGLYPPVCNTPQIRKQFSDLNEIKFILNENLTKIFHQGSHTLNALTSFL